MKTMKELLPKALKLILILTILCGIIYPLIVTGISVIFKDKANGSMIEVNGIKYGSELIGQQYIGEEYLWGRIMNLDTTTFTDENGNAVMYAIPANINTTSEKFETLVAERVEKIKSANMDTNVEKIPVDLVTSSGSGLDPHISIAAANYQVERIAKNRNMTIEEVQTIIDKYSTGRFLGIFGEEVVNVLEVNLALDGILK